MLPISIPANKTHPVLTPSSWNGANLSPLDPSSAALTGTAARWLALVDSRRPCVMRTSMWASTPACINLDDLLADRQGQPIIGMSTVSCPFDWAAGASVDNGLVVEFGTWTGSASRCFAAGVSLTKRKNRMISFDMFELGFVHSNTQKVKGTRFAKLAFDQHGRSNHKADILPIFRWNTEDVYPSIAAVRGNFRDAPRVHSKLQGQWGSWKGRPAVVDVFVTDAAKHTSQLYTDLSTVAPFLHAGSLLILADHFYNLEGEYGYNHQVLWIHSFLVPDYAVLVGMTTEHSAFYALKKPISAALLNNSIAAWRAEASLPPRCAAAQNAALTSVRAICSHTTSYSEVVDLCLEVEQKIKASRTCTKKRKNKDASG
jgi:hypothetical protein